MRQIIDWMFFADNELDDIWWINEFQPAAGSIGLETLTVTVTRMCQLFLCLRNDLSWCHHTDEKSCQELMVYILEQGNFGRKKSTALNAVMVVLNSAQSLPQLLKRLHYHGCHNWKATQIHVWLKLFAGIYQTRRYVFRGLQHDSAIKSLWQDINESHQKDVFLDKLGVVRYEKNIATADFLEHNKSI